MRYAASVVAALSLTLALGASPTSAATPAQVILMARDLPSWRPSASQAFPSRDIIQRVDVLYPRGPRPLDGYIAAFSKPKMALQVYVAQTPTPAAARLVLKHFRAASVGEKLQAVALGSGGWYGESSGLSTGSGVVWASGSYVLGINLNTLAPKAGMTKAQLVALARIMQGRSG